MERVENVGRERVLARIHAALKSPAPRREMTEKAGPIFAAIADPLARFQQQCVLNSTECLVVPNSEGAAEALRNVMASIPAGEIYTQDAPQLHRIMERWKVDRALRWSNEGPPAEDSQATITLAESLIASHGSILIGSSGAGRGASVVAPVHIVVASESQLVPDLACALARAKQNGLAERNSCLFLITGSSRTADIEKILVLGAHGPRRLVVILVRHLD